jgi:hypothetical protein
MPTIGMELPSKSFFFDQPLVKRLLGDAAGRVLSRVGSFIMTTARHSMRVTKHTVSAPGEPPRAHTRLLRDRIFFSYDPRGQSVVIGPTPISMVFFDRDIRPVSGIIPEILEFGGTAGVIEQAVKVLAIGAMRVAKSNQIRWVRRDLRRRGKLALVAKLRENLARGQVFNVGRELVVPTGHHRFRTFTIAPRPYMRPALEQNLPRMDKLWENSIVA